MEGIVANGMTLILSCLFFYWFGLIGLGYALVVDNALCFILYFVVNNRLYGYRFSKPAILNFIIGATIAGGCFLFSFLESPALSYSLMGGITLFSLVWSLKALKSHLKVSE